jgi:hypothetical protein
MGRCSVPGKRRLRFQAGFVNAASWARLWALRVVRCLETAGEEKRDGNGDCEEEEKKTASMGAGE